MAEQNLPFQDAFVIDGKIHRYSSDGRTNRKNEWYVAHEIVSSKGYPGLTVTFGSWSEGMTYTYRSFDQHNTPLSQEDIAEFKDIALRNKLEADQRVCEEQNQAAVAAQKAWNSYSVEPLFRTSVL